MSAIAAPIAHVPHAPLASWGSRDLDALGVLRAGALTLVTVEAGAGRDVLRALARGAIAFDAAGLVRGAPLSLATLPERLAESDAATIVVAGLTDAALAEDAGRALLLGALDALREAATRLDVPVVVVERARRLGATHPLRGVVEARADEIVVLRRAHVVELPARGAQLKIEA